MERAADRGRLASRSTRCGSRSQGSVAENVALVQRPWHGLSSALQGCGRQGDGVLKEVARDKGVRRAAALDALREHVKTGKARETLENAAAGSKKGAAPRRATSSGRGGLLWRPMRAG